MTRFDWEPYDPIKALYGLPVTYDAANQTYLIGGRGGKTITLEAMQTLMGTRPYQNLTGSELARVLGDQLKTGAPIQQPKRVDATVFGETTQTYLGQNVETVFRVGPDGRPEAVTRLVDKPSKDAVRNAGESELAWLKRRVDEICWRY